MRGEGEEGEAAAARAWASADPPPLRSDPPLRHGLHRRARASAAPPQLRVLAATVATRVLGAVAARGLARPPWPERPPWPRAGEEGRAGAGPGRRSYGSGEGGGGEARWGGKRRREERAPAVDPERERGGREEP
ncbi:hypothetical protein C2845_PM13G04500 [Panicum miliaceum]|uniref:Uncharacterized protein n=1 Tax=Panicum miliaceum TaxID=4540 RepID=A0A3L6RLP3_PANMI|nr:hypothetical protein C2845_PM13G04500 [Panicum miliaceum]